MHSAAWTIVPKHRSDCELMSSNVSRIMSLHSATVLTATRGKSLHKQASSPSHTTEDVFGTPKRNAMRDVEVLSPIDWGLDPAHWHSLNTPTHCKFSTPSRTDLFSTPNNHSTMTTDSFANFTLDHLRHEALMSPSGFTLMSPSQFGHLDSPAPLALLQRLNHYLPWSPMDSSHN